MTLPLGALSSNQGPQNSIKKANKGPMKEFFLENQSCQDQLSVSLKKPFSQRVEC